MGELFPTTVATYSPPSNFNQVSESLKIDRVLTHSNKRTYDDIIVDLNWNFDDILHPKASPSVPQVSLINPSLGNSTKRVSHKCNFKLGSPKLFHLPTRQLPCPKPLEIPQVKMLSTFGFKKLSQIPVTSSSSSLTSPTSSQSRLSSSASST